MSMNFLAPELHMEASSNDPQTELDSHDNIVVLGSNSFAFESIEGREMFNCSVVIYSW